jgi:hypothetical protein
MKIAIIGEQDFSFDVTCAKQKLVFTEILLGSGK